MSKISVLSKLVADGVSADYEAISKLAFFEETRMQDVLVARFSGMQAEINKVLSFAKSLEVKEQALQDTRNDLAMGVALTAVVLAAGPAAVAVAPAMVTLMQVAAASDAGKAVVLPCRMKIRRQ